MNPNELKYPDDYFLKLPLYLKVDFSKIQVVDNGKPLNPVQVINGLRYPRNTIDFFCLDCGLISPFSVDQSFAYGSIIAGRVATVSPDYFTTKFYCSRNADHTLIFLFKIRNHFELEKVGQWPSRADIEEPELKKYRRVLGDDKYRELIKGIGLAAHGVGIGSFTYLRRVIEHLIGDAKSAAIAADSKVTFSGLRMEEQIKALRGFLPDFMVDHAKIYGILSKGIHELDEAECLSHFSIIQESIDIILDQRLAKMEQAEKIRKISTALQKADP